MGYDNEEIERAAKLSVSQVPAIGILLRKCVPDLISTEIKSELAAVAGNLGEVKWLKLRLKSRLWQECTPKRP
jgi:hypothetical protein